ncbi:MAG TPA: hypothetical protein VIF15_19980 [Polyangiaceae bacterium]|jgi:hypothetical protein
MRPGLLLAFLAISLTPAASAGGAPPPPPPSGDVQVPADQGATTTLPDGVVVSFEPGCVARWGAIGKLATESHKFTRGFHLELTEGEIEVRVPAGTPEHAFLVSTKAGTLIEWRGRMHVAAREDWAAAAVYEGAVMVGANGQGFPVGDGAGVLLRKNVDPDRTRAIPAAPRWSRGGGAPSFAVVPAGAQATVGIAWGPSAGAASYRVDLASDAAMTHVVQRAATGDTSYGIPAPAPGAQAPAWARVRGVGSDGMVGEWSAPQPLRVVHYQLPDGAFVARDGVVVLPARGVLPLADADGIEVAYESVRPGFVPLPASALYWARLTGPLRLADDAPLRIAHLRDPGLGGGAAETRVLLARRQLRADVQLRPLQARARDPIDVRASAWDPSGRIDVASEKITVAAMADIDPIAVPWQRNGNVWTGRIGPRREAGPTVVRVIVSDSLGEEIGRGFVEIDAATASAR